MLLHSLAPVARNIMETKVLCNKIFHSFTPESQRALLQGKAFMNPRIQVYLSIPIVPVERRSRDLQKVLNLYTEVKIGKNHLSPVLSYRNKGICFVSLLYLELSFSLCKIGTVVYISSYTQKFFAAMINTILLKGFLCHWYHSWIVSCEHQCLQANSFR